MQETNNKTNKKRTLRSQFTTKQYIAFLIGILFLVVGIVCTVLGLIGDYADSTIAKPFSGASAALVSAFHFGLTLTWLGVFFVLVGALIFALSLSFASKNEDRNNEREARRKQRLEAMENSDVIIDATAVIGSTVSESKVDKK